MDSRSAIAPCTRSFLIFPAAKNLGKRLPASVLNCESSGNCEKHFCSNSTFGSRLRGRRFGSESLLQQWKIAATSVSSDCSALAHWTTTKPTALNNVSSSLPGLTPGRSSGIVIFNNLLSGARDTARKPIPIPLQTDHSRFHASAQTKVSVAVEHKLVASGEFLIRWAAPDASLY